MNTSINKEFFKIFKRVALISMLFSRNLEHTFTDYDRKIVMIISKHVASICKETPDQSICEYVNRYNELAIKKDFMLSFFSLAIINKVLIQRGESALGHNQRLIMNQLVDGVTGNLPNKEVTIQPEVCEEYNKIIERENPSQPGLNEVLYNAQQDLNDYDRKNEQLENGNIGVVLDSLVQSDEEKTSESSSSDIYVDSDIEYDAFGQVITPPPTTHPTTTTANTDTEETPEEIKQRNDAQKEMTANAITEYYKYVSLLWNEIEITKYIRPQLVS